MLIRVRTCLSVAAICLGTLSLWPGGALAQTDYPNRPITLVVPFPAGGTTDILARLFADRMSEGLNQRVLVENRGGASGTIAAALVAGSKPDGYTVFISNPSTHSLAPHLFRNLTYDTLAAFAPVALMSFSPAVLVAHPSVGVSTAQELVALLKANPGKYDYASPGNGTGGHLGAERFKAMAGVDMVHVPYKGSAPAIAAVVAGEPKIIIDNIQTALPHVKAGALKALGVAGEKRSPQIPEVPTLAEQGFPGLIVYSWTALFVPAATPQPVIARLNAEANKALKDPLVQKRLEELSTEPIGSTPEELDRFVRREYETWGELVRALNLKMD